MVWERLFCALEYAARGTNFFFIVCFLILLYFIFEFRIHLKRGKTIKLQNRTVRPLFSLFACSLPRSNAVILYDVRVIFEQTTEKHLNGVRIHRTATMAVATAALTAKWNLHGNPY